MVFIGPAGNDGLQLVVSPGLSAVIKDHIRIIRVHKDGRQLVICFGMIFGIFPCIPEDIMDMSHITLQCDPLLHLRLRHRVVTAPVHRPYPERHDIDIYGELSPAKAVGGDLFDFYLHDEQLFFCVGDVSGKGVPASMVMAVICSMFRYISGHTSSPDQIVSDLNNAISEKNEASMFVTLFVGVLDLKSGLMRYSNAGHDAPMLIGRNVGLLPCDPNLPVGVMPGWKFTLQEAVIDRNTTIFLYTDGLNEAEDNLHAQFGKERVQAVAETLLAQKRHQPKTLIASMSDAVQEFVGDAEQSDDLTMLAIQLKDKM